MVVQATEATLTTKIEALLQKDLNSDLKNYEAENANVSLSDGP